MLCLPKCTRRPGNEWQSQIMTWWVRCADLNRVLNLLKPALTSSCNNEDNLTKPFLPISALVQLINLRLLFIYSVLDVCLGGKCDGTTLWHLRVPQSLLISVLMTVLNSKSSQDTIVRFLSESFQWSHFHTKTFGCHYYSFRVCWAWLGKGR